MRRHRPRRPARRQTPRRLHHRRHPHTPDSATLRTHLAHTLPDYMLPTTYITLDALPLTPNGKLDRNALPAPHYTPTPQGRAPRTPQEETLCRLFADTLRLDHVTIDDDFFTLGGDSIRSLQLITQARTTGLTLTVRDIFDHKTVAALAQIHTETDTGKGVDVAGGAELAAEGALTGLSQDEIERLQAEWGA
ncbi:phosphopantetheine-binding protein [Streptomyces sp. NBC_00385]|uniref:phosphopantetheine-binding protein n=1 Tax=Streptomyces sp. NBC_00385 TaxID=2975733 RepID=UPI003FA382BB